MNARLSIAAAIALLLAGCGGGGGGAPPAASVAPPAAVPVPAPPPVAAPAPPATPAPTPVAAPTPAPPPAPPVAPAPVPAPPVAAPPAPAPTPATGTGGIWTSTGSDLLFTSPATEEAQWSGPLDFYYEAFVAACGTTDVGFTGELTANGTGLNGTGQQSNNDCSAPIDTAESFQGTIAPGQSLTLTIIDSIGAQSTINWVFDSLYLHPSSLAALAGQWEMADSSVWAIDSVGQVSVSNVTGTYTGCTATGQISIINSQFNLYSFVVRWTNCPSGPGEQGLTWTGFLALDSEVAPAELLGGGVADTGDGGALNQSLIALGTT